MTSRPLERCPTAVRTVGNCMALLPLLIMTGRAGELAFVPHRVEEASAKYAGVAMGDLNGDGYAEILAGRREGEEGLFVFTSRGTEWRRVQVTGSGQYGGVALADVTGDKILDIIAVKTDGRPKGLELFRTELRDGKVRFSALPSPLTDLRCDDVAVGDIESDGDIDIAVSTGGQGVNVLVNQGKGTSFDRLALPTDVYEDTGIAMGDVNHDGRLDVISANHPGKNLRLFLCSGSGAVRYSRAHTEGLPGAAIGYRIAIADLNGDGLNDLAVGSSRAGMRLFLGNGCKGPESGWWTEGRLPTRGSQTMQVSVGDLNLDGKPDLAFSSQRGIVALLNREGNGPSSQILAGLPERGAYAGCCLFDWDGDGDPDLACTSFQGQGISFYENRLRKRE